MINHCWKFSMSKSQSKDIAVFSCSINPQKKPVANAINMAQPVPGKTIRREKFRKRRPQDV